MKQTTNESTERVVSRPLHIGINVLFLIPGGVGGTEIYTRSLLQMLARVDSINHYYVFRNLETDRSIVPDGPNFHDRPQPVCAANRPARIAYEQTGFLIALALARIDVLLNCGFTAPLCAWMPMATVFYDLQYKHFATALRRIELFVSRALLPASARRSRKIVAMSEAVRSDLERFYPWSKTRIVLIPHGADADFVDVRRQRESAESSSRRFILSVSTLMVHKNFENLLAAFKTFRETHQTYDLVVVGLKGRDTGRLEQIRTRLGLDSAVNFTGWIPRAELLQLFVEASAFVYASRFEGFGIPVLEALTCGLPMACSQIDPIFEIAGEAARYFDPTDVGDISRALCEVIDDEALRVRLIREGPIRSQLFDWTANAKQLVDTFESIRPDRRRRSRG